MIEKPYLKKFIIFIEKLTNKNMTKKSDFYINYNEKLDILASSAMSQIIRGIFSQPIMMSDLDKVARDKGKTLAQEIAFLSYEQAAMMMQESKKYYRSENNEGSQ